MKNGFCTGVLAAACTAAVAASAAGATWSYVGTSGFASPVGELNFVQCSKNPKPDAGTLKNSGRNHRHGIAVDGDGNVFASANTVDNGFGTSVHGGVTIYKASGTIINVDLNAAGYPGDVTKLVAGGDGKIYACQNNVFMGEFGWSDWNGGTHRILRIAADGSVALVFNASVGTPSVPASGDPETDKIRGFTGCPDGNIYWTMNLAGVQEPAGQPDGARYRWWVRHWMWRYNVTTGLVEEAPANNSPDWTNWGYSGESHLLNDLEWAGFDADGTTPLFACVMSAGDYDGHGGDPGGNLWPYCWRADAVGWNLPKNRYRDGYISEYSNRRNPGFGRDYITATAYDPARNILWAGGRGTNNGDAWPYHQDHNTNIMSRWTPAVSGLNSCFDPTHGYQTFDDLDPRDYDYALDSWHANGHNNWTGADPTQGSLYWVTAISVDPGTGSAWMSWAGDKRWTFDSIGCGFHWLDPTEYNYAGTYGPVGRVYTVAGTILVDEYGNRVPVGGPGGDEGIPQLAHTDPVKAGHAAQVVALAHANGNTYALTCDMTTGEYNVFWTGGAWGAGCSTPKADLNGDSSVDGADYGLFAGCFNGTGNPINAGCECADLNSDNSVDGADYGLFAGCFNGTGNPSPCAN